MKVATEAAPGAQSQEEPSWQRVGDELGKRHGLKRPAVNRVRECVPTF